MFVFDKQCNSLFIYFLLKIVVWLSCIIYIHCFCQWLIKFCGFTWVPKLLKIIILKKSKMKSLEKENWGEKILLHKMLKKLTTPNCYWYYSYLDTPIPKRMHNIITEYASIDWVILKRKLSTKSALITIGQEQKYF